MAYNSAYTGPQIDEAVGNMQNVSQEIQNIQSALSLKGNCQIEVQTYTGTGAFGSAYANQLTFSKKPLAVFIFGSGVAFTCPQGNALWVLIDASVNFCTGAWGSNGTTYAWFGSDPAEQMNTKNFNYTVLALTAAE